MAEGTWEPSVKTLRLHWDNSVSHFPLNSEALRVEWRKSTQRLDFD